MLANNARDVTQGLKFSELYQYFPDAIVLGLSDKETGKSVLNPEPSTMIGPDDNLILMRPSDIPTKDYRPLRKPMHAELGDNWKGSSTLHTRLGCRSCCGII